MKITKDEFEKLYRSMTNKELAKLLGVTPITINNYLRKYNIPLKGKGQYSRKLFIIEG